ncbi:Signal recognition particle subunit SRP68 [Mycena sanguinolenta]|uniref:Signal recognition particle subunit SRP68 n=1 Tax=Mycena sanguinolenta TaxID=230812 RepID=A0A8H6YVZ2_9AGAR|nr:Signal recognition particle subunit SRP68 [Mycena sanguinolenta]
MADIVVFKALQLANQQRNAYGLRYNDFARYRKHCANRTHRLRSTLKMTHGKGREFKKLPPITPEIVKDGHLQLLLLEAERAWAYSQELSSAALLPANADQASTLRHSATGRFRRAVNWSTQLLSLSQTLYAASRLSAEDLLQVTIYTLILNGRFLRYRDDRDQALATLFSDEIGPEIRYCAHELGRTKAYDIDGIVAEIAGRHRNQIVEGCDAIIAKLSSEGAAAGQGASRKKLAELIWEDQSVPVRNPELVDVLLKVQEAEHRLDGFQQGSSSSTSKKGVAAYDAILLALSDAEEVARKLTEAQQLSGSSSTSSPGARDIHFVHAYIVYQLLSRRIQRDLLLVSALLSSESSPQARTSKAKSEVDSRLFPAVVKLLDTVLQSLNQMRALSVVDDSPDLASAVEARLSFTKARRCLFLARSYAPVKKICRGSTLSLSDADPISAATPSYYPLSSETVSELEGTLSSEGLHLKRDWFAFNGGEVDSTAKSDKKPLFFDIAVNYVALDMAALRARAGLQPVEESQVAAQSIVEKRQAAKEDVVVDTADSKPAPAAARGGLSSLLGGWWGRS